MHRWSRVFEPCAERKASINHIRLRDSNHATERMACAIVYNSTLLKRDRRSSLFAINIFERVASMDLALCVLVEEAVVSCIWWDGIGLVLDSES